MNMQNIIAKSLLAVLIGMCGTCFTAQAAEPKRIVIYGATGHAGAQIVKEALDRGYSVTGASRNPKKSTVKNSNFTAIKGDVADADSIKSIVAGADAIIVSVSGNLPDNKPENATTNRAAHAMVKALGEMGDSAPRVIQIGGATAMYDTKEAMLNHLPFPAPEGSAMYAMLFGHLEALNTYRASNIKWTFIAPAENILGWPRSVGNRSGKYRTSTTEALRDAKGRSVITLSDLAVAVIDEVENGKFIRQRFTVGY
jgi:uncharacterized protein